jgi:hypothetical protein
MRGAYKNRKKIIKIALRAENNNYKTKTRYRLQKHPSVVTSDFRAGRACELHP